MTRLKTEWIEHMLTDMENYSSSLKEKTGYSLGEIMSISASLDNEKLGQSYDENRVAVVPITQGEGIIGQFTESVASIVKSLGYDAISTEKTDVDGIYMGACSGRNIFFFADDTRYLAINIKNGKVSDNNMATALGFIEALKALMARHGKDITMEKILLIGYGTVGRQAEKILNERNIKFDIYDKNRQLINELPYYKLKGKDEIKKYKYILDYTNEGKWLSKEDLDPEALIATPGVPYSLDEIAAPLFEANAVHDNLEIGTAVMLGQVL